MSDKIYPIGIQNFEKIRRDGYFYIDKTALIYQLVKTGNYYFLSRPRRFGKSLLISTLESYFQGKKELFEGLAIGNLEKDWITYPIFHIDLNTEKYDTLESLESILNFTLAKWEELYGSSPSETTLALRFRGIIERACKQTGKRVVILIDEYDNPIPVIYQSGYLTIKGYDQEFGIYSLGFPNREVEEGFIEFLLPFYANTNPVEAPFEIQKFVREVRAGDYESFFRRLKSFFADTPYELIRDLELHYQNVLFIVFKLIGFYVKAEYCTSEEHIDLVVQTDKFIYVMEFKFNSTAEEALKQIDEKHYALPFETDERKLFRIGVNFDAKMRNIEKWIVE